MTPQFIATFDSTGAIIICELDGVAVRYIQPSHVEAIKYLLVGTTKNPE